MSMEKEREAFEQHPRFRGMDFTRAAIHAEFYASPYANGAWDGWQARATRPAQTAPQPEQGGLVEALETISRGVARHVREGKLADLTTLSYWSGIADAAQRGDA